MDDLTRLAVAAQHGDRRALETFIRRAQPDVWRLCAYLGDRGTADDLAQETFVRAVRSLPRFRAESGARSWLLSIARNTCADQVRRRSRERRLLGRLAGRAAEAGAEAPEPAPLELTDLVGALGDDRREAFVLTQVLGLSYEEAAEVAGCPVGTIRSRVSRARADLVAGLQAAETADATTDAPADRGAGQARPDGPRLRRLG